MKKRAVAVVLSMSMVVSILSGCSTKTGETAGTQATTQEASSEEANTQTTQKAVTEEPVDPTLGTAKTEFANDKLLNLDLSVIQGYEESAKKVTGVDVSIITSPDVAAYRTSIQQSIHDKSAPGMFTWWGGYQLETLVKNGLVEDLTSLWENYITPAGVSSDIADAFTYDGKIYATPYSILYNVVLYNKKVFNDVGVKEPETFDEFMSVCEKIKTSGITPIAFKNDSWAGFIWFQALIASYEPQLYQDLCDGTAKYTDERVVKVMNIWKDMIDKEYFTKPITIQDMEKQFANGEVAMMLEPNREISPLVKDYGMVSGENLDSFVLPSMTDNKKVVFFETAPICVAKASEDKDAALKALEKWYDKEHQNFIYQNIGMANTSKVDVDDAAYKKTLTYSAQPDEISLMLRYYENTPEDIRNVVLDELMRFELGNGLPEDVLKTMQEKADEYWSTAK
ncbi:MAG: extracellular solute-binding protein [Hungatella sp.]